METFEVRITYLEPMRVACTLGFGEAPEYQAWERILAYARKYGLLDSAQRPRFFGFNNPDPSPGSPNYGYEQWMTVGSDAQAEGGIEIRDIPAGRYAVTRFQGMDHIGQMWQRLVTWCETSPYQIADGQCLEEMLSPLEDMDSPEKYVFDLYLPIA